MTPKSNAYEKENCLLSPLGKRNKKRDNEKETRKPAILRTI